MALHVRDAEAMIKTAEAASRQLFVVKQNRYNPPVAAVKKAIMEGRLGKIYSLQLNCFWNRNKDYYQDSWRGSLDLDGGTLYTQFSHFIDLLYWMIGDIKDVKGVLANYTHQGVIEFEDTGIVMVEFLNGAIGSINYTVNSFKRNMEGSLTIFAEKGTVKIGGQYLNELEYQHFDDFRIENLLAGNKANQYGNYEGSMSNHDKVYDNLVNVLCHKGSIDISAQDGLKTVEIIEKIYNVSRRL
jgi:predicted dehydrogenase